MTDASSGDAGVAFVLSGGGSLGAIQVGMLQALYERDIVPDLVAAASAGALNGAFLASRPETSATADRLAEVWSGLETNDVFPFNPLTALLGALGCKDHVVSSSKLRELIEEWIELDDLGDARIPLHVIATDLLSGAELRLSEGPVTSAVLASAALPGVFPPVRRGRWVLVDGGITNNTPLSHAIALGAHKVYVLPTGYTCTLEKPPRGALGVALQSLNVLIQQRLVLDIQRVPESVELVVLPPLCPLDVVPVDLSRGEELIRRSREQSRHFLDNLPDERHVVPELMRRVVHPHADAGRG
ncbi:patatin-like phospholipase family protein [Haloechinothrix salitolerans]|uniref:Patatin-like phospholipase family protein n=1 Tax=Haloechinothrix salitolerans TaxID=926830 RepID=A0ABW2BTP1_9PSEU